MTRKSVDTETTGIDLHHGAKPFLVTFCNEQGKNTFWEADVDPVTREPQWTEEDLDEIQNELDEAEELILQNPKFDVKALSTLRKDFGDFWGWDVTKDTLLAGHLLASNQPHDLTTMTLIYCRVNIEPFEEHVRECTNEARRIARSKYPHWTIAKEGLEMMPSVKSTNKKKLSRGGESESPWKNDMWLCRAIARAEGYPLDHRFWTACADYANCDTASTLPLYLKMEQILKDRDLWEIYLERLKILPIVYKMENTGITLNRAKLEELYDKYVEESKECTTVCLNLAKSYGCELELPKSGVNNSLRSFLWEAPNGLKLPIIKKSKKTGNSSFDKTAKSEYLSILPERSKERLFISKLNDKSSRDTAVSYMESYRRFWIPLGIFNDDGEQLWYKLHPSLNSTGTYTLRFSSQNPNEQNISKKEGFNLRYMFGPAPGREWWSCDAQNIELRLPAYEAGETAMIELFERPNDPPYYGSNHLLAFDVLHPELFAKHGKDVKKVFASTWYQWTKNGNFAVQYGAQKESGTADRAYHVQGAQEKIEKRLGKISDLNRRCIDFANKHGYIETIPDKTVNPRRGYPLYCTRTNYGKVLPTVPLSYHIQGTAMWWMQKAMTRCQVFLDELNEEVSNLEADGFFMVMQVHDELVFDFPVGTGPEPWKTNRPKMKRIQELMAMGGDDIGVPTPVSCEYHTTSWSEGIAV